MADMKGRPKLRGFQQNLGGPGSLGKIVRRHSSALAKDRLKKMIQHQPEALDTPPVPPLRRLSLHFLFVWMRRFGSFFIALVGRVKVMLQRRVKTLHMPAVSLHSLLHFLQDWGIRIASFFVVLIHRLKRMIRQRVKTLHMPAVSLHSLSHFLQDWGIRIASFFVVLIHRLKRMIQQELKTLRAPVEPPEPPQHSSYLLPKWMRRVGSFLVVLVIGGGFALYLQLAPTHSTPSKPKSAVTAVTQIAKIQAPQLHAPTRT